ncbi:MAG: cytochrome c-type biogenesis protein CcmH [Vicinamibacterales bacterium]
MRSRVFVVVAVAAAVLCSTSADAQDATARQQAFTLAGQLMSPFCPGLLLSSCQSQGAHDLKDEITRRLEAGEPQEAIVADLVRRFGPGIRGAPEMQGVGLVAWLGPAVIGGIGVVVLSVALKRFTRRTTAANGNDTAPSDATPALSARVDRELDELD